jgi:hypothetical protein
MSARGRAIPAFGSPRPTETDYVAGEGLELGNANSLVASFGRASGIAPACLATKTRMLSGDYF